MFMGDQIGIMMTFNQSKAFLQGEIQRGELLIQFVFFVIAIFFFIDSDMTLASFVFYLGTWGVFNWITRHWNRDKKLLASGLAAALCIAALLPLLFYMNSTSFETQGKFPAALECLACLFNLFISIFVTLLWGSCAFFLFKILLSRGQAQTDCDGSEEINNSRGGK